MVMFMVVMLITICDQREANFHQVKAVDPCNQYQHLVYVVQSFFLMTVT